MVIVIGWMVVDVTATMTVAAAAVIGDNGDASVALLHQLCELIDNCCIILTQQLLLLFSYSIEAIQILSRDDASIVQKFIRPVPQPVSDADAPVFVVQLSVEAHTIIGIDDVEHSNRAHAAFTVLTVHQQCSLYSNDHGAKVILSAEAWPECCLLLR